MTNLKKNLKNNNNISLYNKGRRFKYLKSPYRRKSHKLNSLFYFAFIRKKYHYQKKDFLLTTFLKRSWKNEIILKKYLSKRFKQ